MLDLLFHIVYNKKKTSCVKVVPVATGDDNVVVVSGKNDIRAESIKRRQRNDDSVITLKVNESTHKWYNDIFNLAEDIIKFEKHEIESLEFCILFELFPLYCEEYNVPYMISDLCSLNSIHEFFDILNQLDSVRITMINKRLNDVFGVRYVCELIILLCKNASQTTPANFNVVHINEFGSSLVKLIKVPKSKRDQQKIDAFLDFTKRNIGSSIIQVVCLTLFGCVEKVSAKTGFFEKCSALLVTPNNGN